jgi:hypothetical protein
MRAWPGVCASMGRPKGSKDKAPRKRPAPKDEQEFKSGLSWGLTGPNSSKSPSPAPKNRGFPPPTYSAMCLKAPISAPKNRGFPPASVPTKSKCRRQTSAINDEDAGRQHGVKNGKGKTKVSTGDMDEESSLAVEESSETCTTYLPLQFSSQRQDHVDGECIVEGFEA